MPKNSTVVLLVHGMGTHLKGAIQEEFIQAVSDRADSFGLRSAEIIPTVDYEEFNYSEYFDAVRKQFEANANARKKGFTYLTGKGFEEKLVTQLTAFETNFGKDEFFYTHWLDVILYGTLYFGEYLRVEFIKKFEKLLDKYGYSKIHVICHSLGTAVVHDALAKYYRSESTPYDDVPDKPLGQFNMASLWTFANVSCLLNLLNNLGDPLRSTVVTGNEGCTNRFINVRNTFDPFTWFKTYRRDMKDIVDVEIDTVRKLNTHDFYEYVTEPRVARGLLQIVYDRTVTTAQLNIGKTEYLKGDLGAQAQQLKDLVRNAASDPSLNTLKAAIEMFKNIQAKIAQLQQQLPS